MTAAVKWANYPTPQSADKVGLVMGPDADGAALTVVEVDGNRLGFAYGVRCDSCFELVVDGDPAMLMTEHLNWKMPGALGRRARHPGCMAPERDA